MRINKTRCVPVPLAGRGYTIVIGPGALQRLPALVRDRRCVLVADERVANLHAQAVCRALGADPPTLVVPASESSKSTAQLARVHDFFADCNLTRPDLVLTLGGGMISDLAGFAAATWLRGIRFLPLPTTLLAAVDASVGGKTAINHPCGKNLIGAFHQPAAVLIDVDLLTTLPARTYRAGLAESVKQAAIRSAAFLRWHEIHTPALSARDTERLVELIAWNCAIKAAVVAADEREAHLRMILNHGHTIAHAIEHEFEYQLEHGECVALGMLVENEIAVSLDWLRREQADRIAALLATLGLPTRLPRPVDPDALLHAAHADKKNVDERLTFALLRQIGVCAITRAAEADQVRAALRAIMPT